jgi:hypothetical protein
MPASASAARAAATTARATDVDSAFRDEGRLMVMVATPGAAAGSNRTGEEEEEEDAAVARDRARRRAAGSMRRGEREERGGWRRGPRPKRWEKRVCDRKSKTTRWLKKKLRPLLPRRLRKTTKKRQSVCFCFTK